MKKRNTLPGLAAILTLSLLFSVSARAEGLYLGDSCWKMTNSEGSFNIFKLAVFEAGDSHFILNGITLAADGEPAPEGIMANGSAEIAGDRAIFMLNGIHNSSGVTLTTNLSINIALDTLDGTYSAVGQSYTKLSKVSALNYFEGDFEFVDCP